MLKKSCAIILSIALAMGILVHGSFAYTWNYPQGSYSFDDFWDSVTPANTSTAEKKAAQYDLIQSYLNNPNSTLFFWYQYNNVNSIFVIWFVCENGRVAFQNNRFYVSESESRCAFGSIGRFSGSYDTYTSGTTATLIDGYSYYSVAGYSDTTVFGSPLYCNQPVYLDGTLYPYANLDLGSLNPDTRYMSVSIEDSYIDYLPYLAVRVDDIPYAYMWISVRYTDQFGPGTEIFDIFDLEYYPGDDYQMYLINPLLISSDEFTVTSVVYSGSLDWGYKEVDGLDLVFNEPYLPDPIPSVTPVPDYNYFDTDIVNYNGGQKDIFYNSFQVNIKRYEDSVPSYFFVDDYGYLNQPFSFNFILLPYYPVQQGFVYDEFIDDCFYQYDVILSEYYDSYFDFFYGSGALNSLQAALSSYSVGADISGALESWYSSHSPFVYTYPYFDDSDLFHLSSDMPALLVVTDSFYFKQTNYLLGDTGDILSQFSERFYKVDGFADTLFGNLLSSYNLDLSFYQNTSRALTGLSYWLNDNSLDNLSYLVNIDTDLHELLEWFQNQEDPDVVLALPYFNPSLLEELYGLNIGELIQFFNGFVSVLPSFDYSDFPNFFDYADDVVADIAGASNSIVDVILDPYEYDDSGLSTFGWD